MTSAVVAAAAAAAAIGGYGSSRGGGRGLGGWQRSVRPSVIVVRGGEERAQPRRKVTILSSQRFRETCAAAGTAAVGGYRDLSL